MSKAELNNTFKALHKEFKAQVKSKLLPLLEKQLASYLDDTITEFKFDIGFNDAADGDCYIEDVAVKITEPAPKTIVFKVNEEVWIEELKEKATIKEINGRTYKVHIAKIDTLADMPKEYISKMHDENKIERDEEGFTFCCEVPVDLEMHASKINDAIQGIDPEIYRALFHGMREDVTLYVSKKGIRVKN